MKNDNEDILRWPEVRGEIARYKWIESETAGYDIGEDRAIKEWLSLYASAWKKAFLSGQISKTNPKRRKRL